MRVEFQRLTCAAALLLGVLSLQTASSANVRFREMRSAPASQGSVSWSNPHHAYVIFRDARNTNYWYVKEISVDKNPSATRDLGGSLTRFCQLFALAIGPVGALYVSGVFGSNCLLGTAGIEIFAPGAHGNVAPIATISGPNTRMNFTSGMAFDRSGNLFTAQVFGGRSQLGAINVYAAGAIGNVAPIRQISGPKTKFSLPYLVAVDAAGEIFAGQDAGGSQILKFAAGARGDTPPVASVTVEPYGHGFAELQVAGPTAYAAVGILRRQNPTIYELSTSDLSLTGTLTNEKFTALTADVDGAGKIFVQNFRGRGRGHLFEYEPGNAQPSRVRSDGSTFTGGYIVVGP